MTIYLTEFIYLHIHEDEVAARHMGGASPCGCPGSHTCEPHVDVLPFHYHTSLLMKKEFIFSIMSESSEQWYNRQAVEQLALHIPFERDTATKSEQIEMLRGLVIRHGRTMDPHMFGFEARTELIRLGLWSRIGPQNEQ